MPPASIRLSVHTDVRRARASLDAFARDQVPFATAKAINRTLEQVQQAARAGLPGHFTLRRKAFVERLVKIERAGFATKQKPVGVVGVQGPRAELLAKFEQGGTKRPTAGGQLAIPRVGSLVKPRRQSVVPDHLRPGELRDSLTLRTFVRPMKSDPAKRALYAVDRVHEARLGARKRNGQRVRKGDARRARPQLLYFLQPQAPLPASLDFVPTAQAIIRQHFVPNLAEAVRAALATARPRR